jgi:MFS family permease
MHGVGFWLVAAAYAVIMAFSAVPTPLYGLYAARDGFGSLTITVVYAVYAGGVILALFTVGHVSDWYGRRRVLIPALLIAALSSVLFLIWRDLAGLMVRPFRRRHRRRRNRRYRDRLDRRTARRSPPCRDPPPG